MSKVWSYTGVLVAGLVLGVWLTQIDWALLPQIILNLTPRVVRDVLPGGSVVIIGALITISVIAGGSFTLICSSVLRRNRVK